MAVGHKGKKFKTKLREINQTGLFCSQSRWEKCSLKL